MGDSSRHGGHGDPGGPERLEVLLLDYETARDDERSYTQLQAALFSVAVALLGIIAATVTQSCQLKAPQCLNKTGNELQQCLRDWECLSMPDGALSGAPLLAVAALAYQLWISAASTIRSYYMRGLEAELRKYAPEPMTALGDVKPMSVIGIATEVTSFRRGRFLSRLMGTFILVSLTVVFGGITLVIGFSVARPWQAVMVLIYLPMTIALIVETAAYTARGNHLFVSAAASFLEHRRSSALPTVTVPLRSQPERFQAQRSLASYLIFPRPEEWTKAIIAPGVFIVAAIATGDWSHWSTFLLVWLVLEYLIYAARYQWNDVRGIADDRKHAARRSRARLPIADELLGPRIITTSLGVATARVAVALLLGWSADLLGPIVMITLGVFALAVLYEALRSDWARSTLPEHANNVSIWVLVGFGYAIRGGVALWLAGIPLRGYVGVFGLAFFAAFGSMFVLLSWVLEATSYCRVGADGRWYMLQEWRQAKSHVATLLSYTGRCGIPDDTQKTLEIGHDSSGGNKAILKDESDQIFSPWNVALVSAMVAGAFFGLALPGQPRAELYLWLAIPAASLAGAFLLASCCTTPQRIFAAATIVTMLIQSTPGASILAVAPYLATMLCYIGFRNSSYRDLKDFAPWRLIPAGTAALRKIGKLLVGASTWKIITKGSRSKPESGSHVR